MGVYINPEGMTKEEFLKRNGRPLDSTEARKWDNFKDEFLVCLVSNGSFTAAGVAYDKREKEGWMDKSDPRLKMFYAVNKESLLPVSPLEHYLKVSEK